MVVTNTGTATLTSLVVSDTLPAGLSYSADSNTAGLAHASVGQLNTWSGPVTFNPGTTVTITLDVLVACAAGANSTTALVSGANACGAAFATAPDALNVPAPGALISAAAGPAVVSTGQTFTVTQTVTNTGGSAATGVAPTLAINGGAVSVVTAPAGLGSLAAGASSTFVWTLSATGAGSAGFTLSATGTVCGGVTIVAARTLGITVESAATLAASLTALPSTAVSGQSIVVSLTVTNSGQATATGVVIQPVVQTGAGSATTALVWTPSPAFIPGNSSITFTLTYTAGSVGTVVFSTSVTGNDVNSAAAVGPAAAVSGPVLITSGPNLVAAVYASKTQVSVGQAFQVTLTVTNNGGASALAVSAALWQFNGTATANISAPTPGVVASLAAGGWTSYTWTVTATGAGSLGLTGSATGTGPVVSNQPAVVVGVTVGDQDQIHLLEVGEVLLAARVERVGDPGVDEDHLPGWRHDPEGGVAEPRELRLRGARHLGRDRGRRVLGGGNERGAGEQDGEDAGQVALHGAIPPGTSERLAPGITDPGHRTLAPRGISLR